MVGGEVRGPSDRTAAVSAAFMPPHRTYLTATASLTGGAYLDLHSPQRNEVPASPLPAPLLSDSRGLSIGARDNGHPTPPRSTPQIAHRHLLPWTGSITSCDRPLQFPEGSAVVRGLPPMKEDVAGRLQGQTTLTDLIRGVVRGPPLVWPRFSSRQIATNGGRQGRIQSRKLEEDSGK